jgi:hypothetical protein
MVQPCRRAHGELLLCHHSGVWIAIDRQSGGLRGILRRPEDCRLLSDEPALRHGADTTVTHSSRQ